MVKGVDVWLRGLKQGLYQPRGVGWGGRWEGVSKGRGYMYTYGWFTEKAMAPDSSTFAWKIPWMEEPGRLQSMGSLRVEHDWATSLSLFTFTHWRRKWQPTPVFLPGESQGWGAWWAALYGVTQRRTWLKRLSSNSRMAIHVEVWQKTAKLCKAIILQ